MKNLILGFLINLIGMILAIGMAAYAQKYFDLTSGRALLYLVTMIGIFFGLWLVKIGTIKARIGLNELQKR